MYSNSFKANFSATSDRQIDSVTPLIVNCKLSRRVVSWNLPDCGSAQSPWDKWLLENLSNLTLAVFRFQKMQSCGLELSFLQWRERNGVANDVRDLCWAIFGPAAVLWKESPQRSCAFLFPSRAGFFDLGKKELWDGNGNGFHAILPVNWTQDELWVQL